MERETGIEPALVAWKATVLPLNYSRPDYFRNRDGALSNYLRRFHPLKAYPKKTWWREVDYSGHPALRPSGSALRAVQIRSCEFVEPVFYFRWFSSTSNNAAPKIRSGGGRWIRTTEGMSQQIYSLPPLAAWVSLHGAAYFQAPKAPLSRTVLPGQAECPPVQARCAASR